MLFVRVLGEGLGARGTKLYIGKREGIEKAKMTGRQTAVGVK